MAYNKVIPWTILLSFFNCISGLNVSLWDTSNKPPASRQQADPLLDPSYWWGPDDDPTRIGQDQDIRPFQIEFTDAMIEDLRHRLKHQRRFTPPLQGVGFRYGFNSGIIEEWLHHWANNYPFREREWYFNKFPMYKTSIQGLNIQFIWIKPKVPPEFPVLPLLMLHGWPGSIREFYESIPMLTGDLSRGFAVELVVPSLPGFGFSDASCKPGLGGAEMAVVMRNLMMKLGHQQFYVQGGDIGASINTYMATLFPENVLGFHSNLATNLSPLALILVFLGQFNPSLIVEPRLANRIYPLQEKVSSLLEEFGYFYIQATKPDTIGIALSDSPAGLLAWILEKVSAGTNIANRDLPDGGLSGMNKDFLIDNLMMYWVPNSMTTAMRFYADTFNRKLLQRNLLSMPTLVPFWALQAQHEIIYQPPAILRLKFPNLINATALDFGGHFFAFERPREFTESVLDALTAFRRWHQMNKDLTISSDAKTKLRELINISTQLQIAAERSGILSLPLQIVNQTMSRARDDWINL